MRASIFAASLLAACVSAISVNTPTKNQVVDLAAGFKVTWSSVSSDPTTAHLFLVNQAGGHTPYSKDLGEVDLKSGSVTVIEKDVPEDSAYQFNLQSVDPLNTGILAQSQQFEVKGSDEEDSSSSSSSTTTTSSSSITSSATSTGSASEQTLGGGSGTSSTITSSAASTFTTATTDASATGGSNASKTSSGAHSTSTAAAPTGKAVQGSSLLALAIGLVAVVM